MKRVSISFVLRFYGFQSTAEVKFGAHKSHRISSLERPRRTAALIPSKVWCGRQDRCRWTVFCPSCYLFHRTHSRKPWEFSLPTNILLSPKLLFGTEGPNRFFFPLCVPCALLDIHIWKELNAHMANTSIGLVFDHCYMFRHVRDIVRGVFQSVLLFEYSYHIPCTKRNAGTRSVTHRKLHNVPDDADLCSNSIMNTQL